MRKLAVLILICMLGLVGCDRAEKEIWISDEQFVLMVANLKEFAEYRKETQMREQSTWMSDEQFEAMLASLKKSIAENRYETLKVQQALALLQKPIQATQSYNPPAYKLGKDKYTLLDQWQTVPNGEVRDGISVHIGEAIEARLIIDVALTTAYRRHNSTLIELWITLDPAGNDEFIRWRDFISITGSSAGTRLGRLADKGATSLTTTLLGDSWVSRYEDALFILDDEVDNSEIVLRTGFTAGSILLADGLLYAHDEMDWVYNIVDSYVIDVPVTFHKIKVVINNGYDKDGSRVHTRTRAVVRRPNRAKEK